MRNIPDVIYDKEMNKMRCCLSLIGFMGIALACSPAPAITFSVSPIPGYPSGRPGYGTGEPMAINDSGVIVGSTGSGFCGQVNVDGSSQVFSGGFGYDVNNAGLVVVHTPYNDGITSIMNANDGSIVQTTPAFTFNGFGINDLGQVVGGSPGAAGQSPGRAQLLDGATTTTFGVIPDGFGHTECSLAYSINNAGTIVGQSVIVGGIGPARLTSSMPAVFSKMGVAEMNGASAMKPSCGVVWYDDPLYAARNKYCDPNGYSPTGHGYYSSGGAAADINDSGLAAGWVADDWYDEHTQTYGSSTSIFVYDSNTDVSRIIASINGENPPVSCWGDDCVRINDLGHVTANLGMDPYGRRKECLFFDGQTARDVNSLLDPGSDWHVYKVLGLNNKDQIIALAEHLGNDGWPEGYALLLTPVPEPSVSVFLCMGVISLLVYGWKKGAVGVPRT